MDTVYWVLSIFTLGFTTGVATSVIWSHWAASAQAERRSERRRVLGLEDRPAAQPGAIGHARIRTGNIKREVRGL